jgi:hypothetical protein
MRRIHLVPALLALALAGTTAIAAPETYVLDKAAHTCSVDIAIDTHSVDSGVPLLNEHLAGPATSR